MPITVRILRPSKTIAYDVTDRVEGLQYSNVNPGGHERCTFTLKGDWGAGFPEVQRGNIVRVEDGLQELFTGRIDEQDPQLQDAEQVSVTAYGLGIRMKDDLMREIYVDSDMSRWQGPSVARRITLAPSFRLFDPQATFDTGGGSPALLQSIQGPWAASDPPLNEAWYDAHGIDIESIYFAWKVGGLTSFADANWQLLYGLVTTDNLAAGDFSGDRQPSGNTGTGTLTAAGAGRVWAMIEFNYGAVASTSQGQFDAYNTCLAIYGTHGLTKQGTATATKPQGFFGSQIVRDVCERLDSAGAGIRARRIDDSTFILTQLVFLNDVAHQDVITEVSKYHEVDWGVWGADVIGNDPLLADATIGYLDWTARDSSIGTWRIHRDECDAIDLHTEIGSTYNQVAVNYTDATGQPGRVVRTIASDALLDAGIKTRTANLDGGTLDAEGAQQLGDAFLQLSAGQPVSRGSATISGHVHHFRDGLVPAHFMRADGSNLFVPDAFADRDALALNQPADRRSIFPIKRITVDCSGDKPTVTAELDQTHDLLSILLARLQLSATVALGS